jgi:hypothetical protein
MLFGFAGLGFRQSRRNVMIAHSDVSEGSRPEHFTTPTGPPMTLGNMRALGVPRQRRLKRVFRSAGGNYWAALSLVIKPFG